MNYNASFPRIITVLRKERKISQKVAAEQLGISQALLSHYEKGIRECGLDFVVRTADFYNVSCDYLLGRTLERNGAQILVSELPEPETMGTDHVFKGSMLPALNKKLIANSLNVVFDILKRYGSSSLTAEVSAYLMVAVYSVFRSLYCAGRKNPQEMFSVDKRLEQGKIQASLCVLDSLIRALVAGEKVGNRKGLSDVGNINLSPEIIANDYPLFSSSLFKLIQCAEERIENRD